MWLIRTNLWNIYLNPLLFGPVGVQHIAGWVPWQCVVPISTTGCVWARLCRSPSGSYVSKAVPERPKPMNHNFCVWSSFGLSNQAVSRGNWKMSAVSGICAQRSLLTIRLNFRAGNGAVMGVFKTGMKLLHPGAFLSWGARNATFILKFKCEMKKTLCIYLFFATFTTISKDFIILEACKQHDCIRPAPEVP